MRNLLEDLLAGVICFVRPSEGSVMGRALNCLFTAIILPLGVWVLVYGIVLLVRGETDSGVFLLLLALLLLGAVGSGLWRTVAGNARKSKRAPERKRKGKK